MPESTSTYSARAYELNTAFDTAVAAGFDRSFVSAVLEQLGPTVLDLLVKGVNTGFSVTLLTETLKKAGPTVLNLLVLFMSQKQTAVAAVSPDTVAFHDPSQFVVGEELVLADNALLLTLLQTLLPQLLEKYGPQLLKVLVDLVLSSLKK